VPNEPVQTPAEPSNPEPLDTGWLEVCLNVKDLEKSLAFYQKLDFEQVSGDPEEKWVVLANQYNTFIALYQGHIGKNLLNFRGGDIQKIADKLKDRGVALKSEVESEPDGSLGVTIEDPDGNILYFNTHPDELEECGCDCDCEEGECDCEEGVSDCGCGHEEHHHHHSASVVEKID
jgi:lactoylglutathione lyase